MRDRKSSPSELLAITRLHRDIKTTFAHHLADVLAAAPVTLGDLCAAMSDHVRAKVSGEVAHDLTKIPNGDVADHLKSVLAA